MPLDGGYFSPPGTALVIKELHVFDPYEHQPALRLTWWPRDTITSKHQDLLLQLAQAPAPVKLEVDELLKGERATLAALWTLKESPERQRALLRAAMLFSECNSNDGRRDWCRVAWAHSLVAENLAQAQIRSPWGPLHTRVIPRLSGDNETVAPTDVIAFKAYLEQALDALLTTWAPAAILCNQGPVTLIEGVLLALKHRQARADRVAAKLLEVSALALEGV